MCRTEPWDPSTGFTAWAGRALSIMVVAAIAQPLDAQGVTQLLAERRYELGEAIFESTDFADESVSQLGRLSGGIMLADDRIVLADGMGTHLLFVGLADRLLTRVGRKGEGPGEFKSLRVLGRASPNGVFVDDPVGARVTVFSDDGSLIGSVSYNPGSFRGSVMVPRPIYADHEGNVLFRDADPLFSVRDDGPYREQLSYIHVRSDGSRAMIAEAQGREMVRRNGTGMFSVYEKPFSYSTLEASYGDRLLVADTETGIVAVYDRNGEVGVTLDAGRGVPVSAEADAQWRTQEIADSRLRRSRTGPADPDAPPGLTGILSGLGGAGQDAEAFYRTADGNTIAPSLSGMFVDGSGRAWLQRYAFPDDEIVRWLIWGIHEGDVEAIVEVPANHAVLDAMDDKVLVRTTDDLGVSKAVVRRLKRIS